jgi:hypothetical protein
VTKLVERVVIDIELDAEPSSLERTPRDQLRMLWPAIGHIKDTRGKWCISGPGLVCWITNLGQEEVPELEGGDN